MVTSRAVLFGFIGGCFYLIAIVNALPPLFYALMWLTAGILSSCFGIALLSLYGLRATWKLDSSAVAQAAPGLASRASAFMRDDESPDAALSQSAEDAAGGGVGLTLEIGNAGTFNKSDIVIEVHLRALSPHDEAAGASAGRHPGRRWGRSREGAAVVRRFLIEALPSRALVLTTLPLHDLERGRYSIALVRAVGSDVLGLFRLRKNIPATSGALALDAEHGPARGAPDEAGPGLEAEEALVVVGPRVVRLERGRASAPLGSGGKGSGTTAMAGRSDEFGGTRPYVAGDDLRFVHWKSTARRGEMVVREWERAALRRSIVLWDGAAFPSTATSGSSSASPAPSPGEAPALREGVAGAAWRRGVEWSLEVALSLANALAEKGEPCTLWRLDSSPRRAEVSGPTSLARGAGLLADAQASRASELHEALRAVSSQAQAGARDLSGRVFIVTLMPSASLLASARRLRESTVVLLDISRLDSRPGTRAQQAAWRGWSQALDESESQLREAGFRVLRLPEMSEPGPEPQAQPGFDHDSQTRRVLRALLDEREQSRARAGARAST